jgi:hypothetical protein
MIKLTGWGLTNRNDGETISNRLIKKNPNSNGTVATDYKRSRNVDVPPGQNPNSLDTIHGSKAKNGGATPR